MSHFASSGAGHSREGGIFTGGKRRSIKPNRR